MGILPKQCSDCKGDGLCIECAGTGRVECLHCDEGRVPYTYWDYEADEPVDTWDYCDRCDGSGRKRCDVCNGSGLCYTCNGSGTEEVA